MDTFKVTLRDASAREGSKGTMLAGIAQQISLRLAEAALVARISTGAGGAATGVRRIRPDGSTVVY